MSTNITKSGKQENVWIVRAHHFHGKDRIDTTMAFFSPQGVQEQIDDWNYQNIVCDTHKLNVVYLKIPVGLNPWHTVTYIKRHDIEMLRLQIPMCVLQESEKPND